MKYLIKISYSLLLMGVFLISSPTMASHIIGGELSYIHIAGSTYKIKLITYQDCGSSADVDNPQIYAYAKSDGSTSSVTGNNIFDGYVSTTYIPNPCLQAPASTCLRKKIFEVNMNLPPGKGGYDLNFEEFSRAAGIDNLNLPDQWSNIYYCVVPDIVPPNNSPTFPNDPPPNLCINDTFRYAHHVIDQDGDSIVYKWCNPKGNIVGTTGTGPAPYPNVPWCCGYGTNNPIPSAPPFTINPATGLMEGVPNLNGNYVYSVCYEEYRNGVLINESARDYMFRVTNCSPRSPVGNTVAQGGAASLGYCSDMTVNFKNASVDAETFYWDFGDTLITTDTSTMKEPTYTYNQAGVYTIMLVANPGTDCADTTTIDYEIFPEIDIFFIPPPAICFYGGEFDFETLGQFDTTDTFEWDFGPNAVVQYSTEQNPSGIMFTEPGFFPVTLTVTNGVCTSTFSDIVEVLDSPNPYFDQPDDQCIDNNSYTFIAKGDFGSGSEILWSLGEDANRDSVTSPTAANITYADTGMHVVSLLVTENGCTIEYKDTFYIVLPPVASFEDLSAPQCLNINSYDFWPTGEASPVAKYNWDFGFMSIPSSASTDSVFGVTFQGPGIYNVTLTIDDGGCIDIYQDQIEIVEAPLAYTFDQDPQCILDNSFDFKGTGVFGSAASFEWNFGPNASPSTSTNQNVNGVTFDTPGIYPVDLTISENGCPDTYTVMVEVTPEPISSFENIPNQCISNGPFDFNFDGIAGKYASYQWIFPNDATILSDSTTTSRSVPEVDFGTPGSHTIKLTVSENGCTDVYEQTFNLTPSPIAKFAKEEPQCFDVHTFNFTNTGDFGVNAAVSWDFGPSASPTSSTATNPSGIRFASPGAYAVTVSVTEFGCTDVYTDSVYVTKTPTPFFLPVEPQCIEGNSFNFELQGTFTDAAIISWDFGPTASPRTSSVKEPGGIKFNNTGTFPVTVSVSEYGCVIEYVDYVTVTPAPVPFFITPESRCVNDNKYDFQAGGQFGQDATFSWNFGTSSNQNPSIVNQENVNGVSFTSPGFHQITLTISENGCTYSYTDSVLITPDPIPFINSVNDQCVTINKYAFDPTGSSYGDSAKFYWDFGPFGSPRYDSTLTPDSVTFSTVGSHDIFFSIEENGCVIVETLTVNITAPPQANFALNGVEKEQCINNQSFDFTPTGSYGTTANFDWNFGNTSIPPTSSQESPQGVKFASIGWHYVTLTVTENGCPETFLDSILITAVPSAYTAKVDTQCVDNNTYNFVGEGSFGPNATFEWDFAGATSTPNIVNTQNANGVKFNIAGTHNITYTVEENGCSDTYTLPVHVTPSPNAEFTSNKLEQCVSDQSFDFNITNLAQHGENAVFSWDFGSAANISSSSDPRPLGINFTDSGRYEVKLTIEENGCSDTYSLEVAVYPLPIPDFTANQTGCAPFEVTFNNESYAWTELSYFWDFGDNNTSTEKNPVHIYETPGNYSVSLYTTVAGNLPCSGQYDTVKTDFITVYPSPVPNFTVDRTRTDVFDPIITVQNTSTDGKQVLFDFGDGTVIMDPAGGSYAHKYQKYGKYDIVQTVINEYGCEEQMIIQIEIESVFKFYAPNVFTPNGDNMNDAFIQSGIGFEDGEYILLIFNRWGEEIFQTTNPLLGWDGIDTKNNRMAPQGSYAYVTKIIDNYGVEHKFKGLVSLIR